MANDIAVVSSALILIGDTPITDWSESDGGTAGESIYLTTKHALLASYPWSFALKSERLSLNSEVPDTLLGYTKSHKLPPDFLRLWRLLPEGLDYTIQGENVLSSATNILAEYTYDCQENEFSDSFREALEYLLASKLAMSVTENSDVAQLMLIQHRQKLAEAKHIDSTQKPQVSIVDAPFHRARQGGGTSGYFA